MSKPTCDTTVARIAGNIASVITGELVRIPDFHKNKPADVCISVAASSVAVARAIVAEVQRTQPEVPHE